MQVEARQPSENLDQHLALRLQQCQYLKDRIDKREEQYRQWHFNRSVEKIVQEQTDEFLLGMANIWSGSLWLLRTSLEHKTHEAVRAAAEECVAALANFELPKSWL